MGDDERLGVAEHALVEAGDLQFLVDGDGDIDFRVVLLDRRQAIGGRGAYQADHVEIVEQYAAHRIAERRRMAVSSNTRRLRGPLLRLKAMSPISCW